MSGTQGYQRFFAELKRRRVFRVMAMYGVVAFGVLQVADIAFPRLGMPEWTITLVLLLSLLGFPIAIVLAWAFEQTPEGLKRTEDAAEHEIAEIASAPAGQRWPVGVAAAVGTALFLVGAWWMFDGPGPDSVATVDTDAPVESIAVLPFADMSPDGDQAYFGDGLAEELLDALAKVDGLIVAARTSSFRFRGDTVDIGEVAEKLGVQTVLEGSVRSGGDRVRITAQLVNADGFHLWSDRYDFTLAQMQDLISVQEEIAQAIVAALSLAPDTLAGEVLETLIAQGTDNLEAYNAFLRGRHLGEQRNPESMESASVQFERAVELDPDYALAWAHLAMTNNLRMGWGFAVDSAALQRGEFVGDGLVQRRSTEALQRALELNPLLAEAYTAQGYAHTWLAYDSAAADQAFARAIELNPRFPTAWHWRGELLSDYGYPEAGIPYLEEAHRLDPLSSIIMVDLGEAYIRTERYAEGERLIESAFELEPNFLPAVQSLGMLTRAKGDADGLVAATRRYGEMIDAEPGNSFIVPRLAFADRHAEVVAEFRRAVPTDTSTIPWYSIDAVPYFLASLNITEGPEAVRSFVDAHAEGVALDDSTVAVFIRGFAAAVSGDAEEAYAAIDYLGRSFEDGRDATLAFRLAGALGDLETALAIFETFPPENYNVSIRFNLDHFSWFDGFRDDPRFQEFMDRLPPYYVPEG
jgi:TolB-like protein/Tfp pilus assembly protein PilF